jgi:hypothetical protein
VGGIGSGNKGANKGKRYWTRGREEEYRRYLEEQKRQKEIRRERQKIQARELGKLSMRRQRAKARAEGRVLVADSNKKPEPPGSSTPRVRRCRERQRVQKEAAHVAELAARREAEGKERIRTSTERARLSRERKAAKRAAYLASQWWSPALSESDAHALIQEQHPAFDTLQVHLEYVGLLNQANGWRLNLNRFTIAADGFEKANKSRAIFNQIQIETNTADYAAVLQKAEITTDLQGLVRYGDPTDATWQKNLVTTAIDCAARTLGNGSSILQMMEKNKEVYAN